MCVYVYVYIYIYIYIYIHTHTDTYIHIIHFTISYYIIVYTILYNKFTYYIYTYTIVYIYIYMHNCRHSRSCTPLDVARLAASGPRMLLQELHMLGSGTFGGF